MLTFYVVRFLRGWQSAVENQWWLKREREGEVGKGSNWRCCWVGPWRFWWPRRRPDRSPISSGVEESTRSCRSRWGRKCRPRIPHLSWGRGRSFGSRRTAGQFHNRSGSTGSRTVPGSWGAVTVSGTGCQGSHWDLKI